jgi:hypothetical protein
MHVNLYQVVYMSNYLLFKNKTNVLQIDKSFKGETSCYIFILFARPCDAGDL